MSLGRDGTADWAGSGPQGRQLASDTLFDSLCEIIMALWRRRLWIVVSALCAILLALTFLVFTNPLYSSTAQLLIDPRAKQLLQTEVVPSGLGSSSMGPDTLLVNSQVEIILSDAVLGRVVERVGLADDPEFARPGGRGLSSVLVGLGRSPARASTDAAPPMQSPVAAALESLRKRTTVKREGNTYVISITVLSGAPAMARRLADAIAEAYLDDAQEAARESTRQTTSMLAARLDELREEVRLAEDRVEAYRERHGLIGAQDLLINEQQLRDLNDRLTEARTRTSETRVKFESLSRLAEQGVAGVEAMSEAIASTVIAGLRATYADIIRELSHAEMVYGPRHPARKAWNRSVAGSPARSRRSWRAWRATPRSNSRSRSPTSNPWSDGSASWRTSRRRQSRAGHAARAAARGRGRAGSLRGVPEPHQAGQRAGEPFKYQRPDSGPRGNAPPLGVSARRPGAGRSDDGGAELRHPARLDPRFHGAAMRTLPPHPARQPRGKDEHVPR
jgi:uncharacterized protein involved in exopolysaccharide biosynthesis